MSNPIVQSPSWSVDPFSLKSLKKTDRQNKMAIALSRLPAELVTTVLHTISDPNVLSQASVVCRSWLKIVRKAPSLRIFTSSLDTLPLKTVLRQYSSTVDLELTVVRDKYPFSVPTLWLRYELSPTRCPASQTMCIMASGNNMSEVH